jgi:hydroxymethylbilane synthase
MNERLGGGCHAPIAGYAKCVNHHLILRGMVANPLTNEYLEDEAGGSNPQRVGFELAEKLIAKGARRLFS